MKVLYNDQNSNLGNQPQYNGNISAMIWKNKKTDDTDPEKGYAFSYDDLNRITASDYKSVVNNAWTNSATFEENAISYDSNGNIMHLERTGATSGTPNTYAYNYTGNQLQSITGKGSHYAYDSNGNMTTDGLREFTVSYNQLNLPQTISKGSENISYIYSATGEKLAKRMKDNTYQYYAGNMVYGNDKALDYILFEEGRVTRNAQGGMVYNYFIKDHLGNTRVSFSPGGTNQSFTEYYPFGMNYSTSSRDAKYLYNGKEIQDDILGNTALDWYDYGARFYDPQIGRFSTIDPMAEKFFPASPYSYCVNNPVLLPDVNGKDWTITMTEDKDGKKHYIINLTVAVLNSTGNSSYDKFMGDFAKSLKKQVESSFSTDNKDFSVKMYCTVTVVKDKTDESLNDGSEDQFTFKPGKRTLVELKNWYKASFNSDDPKTMIPGSAENGRDVYINEKAFWSMLDYPTSPARNNKTLPHELGHTAGLRHPLMDTWYNRTKQFFTGNPPSTNFMYQGTIPNATGVTKGQIERMYNLYESGALNKATGVHPVDNQ